MLHVELLMKQCGLCVSSGLTLPCSAALGPGQRAGPWAHLVHGVPSHAGVWSVQRQLIVSVDESQVLHAETPQLVWQHALPLVDTAKPNGHVRYVTAWEYLSLTSASLAKILFNFLFANSHVWWNTRAAMISPLINQVIDQQKVKLLREDLLIFFVSYHCKLNIFGLWTVGRKQKAIGGSGKLWRAYFLTFFGWLFN